MNIKKTIRKVLRESIRIPQEDIYTSENNEIKALNRVLNINIKKKYDWLIEIKITYLQTTHNRSYFQPVINGIIKVNEDWFGDKWFETYDSYNAPNPNVKDIRIGELHLGIDAYKLSEDIKTALKFVFTKDIKTFHLNEFYYRTEENNKELIESEITEKCWKGYTQKGMKTMFGKRYPNCVKKKKK